jgi:hypothetical protein
LPREVGEELRGETCEEEEKLSLIGEDLLET